MRTKFKSVGNDITTTGLKWISAVGVVLCGGSLWAGQINSNLSYTAALELFGSYDSNVYLQDVDPDPANVTAAKAAGLNPVEANKASWVSRITPSVGLSYRPSEAFRLDMDYVPCFQWYHNARSEDFIKHDGNFNLSGDWGERKWQVPNRFIFIDGNSLGPTFARPGSIPSIGGLPLRNRRDAFVYVGGFKLTQPLGDNWFVRPVFRAYVHDFMTEQLPNPSPAQFVYENYIDRYDLGGGADVGVAAGTNAHFVVGYRYGTQHQGDLLGVASTFQNDYQRLLFGLEGSPAPWLKLNFMAGPDFRYFPEGPARPGFDTSETLFYADGSISVLPSANDNLTFFHRRYAQPAFAGFSIYEDITYDFSWKHKFCDHWSATAGFKIYIGDWQPTFNRDDWIYTPRIELGYTVKGFKAVVGYAYDWTESKVEAADNAGREFTRHIVSATASYTF
jgi:hypothetical protein